MRGKALMFQGTASSVGKSLLCCAFLRILKQDGYRVAPFKAQNMALNSFATRDGLEMGRAQVTQAYAAGIEPSVLMNPVLLKPTGDRHSQVIAQGKPLGNYSAMAYERLKPSLREMIRQSYTALEESVDAVILEGAGSPAEINLKAGDIVNMAMAEMADAPVILIGDINPGGVFAALYGTVMLLPENERQRIKGILINKFRGDVRILKPGLRMLEELLGIPVLGVVPWMDVALEDEDSLSEKLETKRRAGMTQIAILRLPHLSNYTDFDLLLQRGDVSCFFTDSAQALREADWIILPGTKSTIADLLWLKERGLDEVILSHASQGKPILGICGGFQMLGTALSDPYGVESLHASATGLGLLDLAVTFGAEKAVRQVQGIVRGPDWLDALQGRSLKGYEIHQGENRYGAGAQPFLKDEAGRFLGIANAAGNVLGTYMHGILDDGCFIDALLARACEGRGAPRTENALTMDALRERELDRLAAAVRRSVDMRDIDTILRGSSVPCGRWNDNA